MSAELTTAWTDAMLALVCGLALVRLLSIQVPQRWKQVVWAWVLGLVGAGAIAGAVVHGFEWSPPAKAALWAVILLSLVLMLAAFSVAVISDARGEAAGRKATPWVAALGVALAVVIIIAGGAFRLFVIAEFAVMVTALGVYAGLAVGNRLPGAGLIAAGIGVTLVAGLVQMSRVTLNLIVPLDHNGLFHLVQIIGAILLIAGVRRSLRAVPRRPIDLAGLINAHPYIKIERPPELWRLAVDDELFIRFFGELIAASLVRNGNRLEAVAINFSNVVIERDAAGSVPVGEFVAVTSTGEGVWGPELSRRPAPGVKPPLAGVDLESAAAAAGAAWAYTRNLGDNRGSVTVLFPRALP